MDLQLALSNFFLDPVMGYAFLLVLIFLLFYFIRPKPRYQVMPSLMFLFRDAGKSRTSNLIRNLITNLLFLLQLLILVAIIAASAKPFINVSKDVLFKNTVVVLDVSASMKAPFEGKTRFDSALKLAKDNLGSVNTIILVKKSPEAAVVDESAGKAKDFLSKLQASDSTSSIYSAINAAGSYAKADSRVVVISDFAETGTDTDLNTIKKTLESQGIKVDFIKVGTPVPNVGIVELSITDEKTTAVVKNFNPTDAEVKMKINDLSENLKIKPDSREVFTFTTPSRTNKLEMQMVSGQDSFENDNFAYISAPSDVKKNVLFITNNLKYQNSYIYNALDVMKSVQMDVAIPPKIPDLGKYDIYVFKDVDPALILPGTFTGVRKEVEENGKAAIIMAQPTFLSLDYQGILPLIPLDQKSEVANIIPTGSEGITSGIEFGTTKIYFDVKPIDGRIISAIATTENKNPLIVFNKLGQGGVIYYGILDETKEAESFFGKSPAYFVFWKRTVDFITNTPSVKNLNYKTGSIISFPEEQRIDTPTGRITTKNLVLDNQGLYTLKDRTIAINLLEEGESDVTKDSQLSTVAAAQGGDRFKDKVPYELTDYMIYLALLVLMLELLYVKMRGDF